MVVPAAQYLRMSTEHQQYSLDNQSAAIRQYADDHGFVIIQTYQDVAKSGLMLRKRPGLAALLNEVISQQARFRAILVLDVTRWGRFQDVDESAHYEFLCKRAGIQVRYCAEQFENDNSPTSNLLKSLKRLMAGEYSRELSSKVFIAQCKLASQGYKQGGPAPYGTRRQVISKNGLKRQTLEWGEQKSIATDRVVLVPGPAQEISNIRYIFDSFTKRNKRASEICTALNRNGRAYRGRPWAGATIRGLLRNPI